MTPELVSRNLAIYTLQTAVLIGSAALLVWMFRLQAPRARLAVWHVVLAGCLLLPLVTPWQQESSALSGAVDATAIVLGTAAPHDSGIPLRWPFTLAETVLIFAVAGATARLLRIGAGVWKLRGMTRRAQIVAPLTPPLRDASIAAGADVSFRWSEEVAGPVTFGLRSPVILLPVDFARLAGTEQFSVALHEALHVRRRDWVFTMAEEFVRALLWFHPGVWFLLSRIQLAREQAVDQAVIDCTRQAHEYVRALLKIAAAQFEPDLAPAPLFLKRRHLHARVAAIVKGAHMSKSRLLLAIFAVLTILPVVAGLVAWQLPLRAQAQTVPDSAGVEIKTGPFKVLHRTAVMYPMSARETDQEGAVVVSVTVDRKGEVTDARVVSSTGPDELRRAVLSSVLQWHFSMEPVEISPGDRRPVPSSFEIAIGFHPAKAPRAPHIPVATPDRFVTVEKIDLSRLPTELRDKAMQALTIREGQSVTSEELDKQQPILRAIDSHLNVMIRLSGEARDRAVLTAAVREQPVSLTGAVPPPPEAVPPQRIRVGGNVQAVNIVTKVTPKYPPEAKAARIQGTVKMTVTIGKDGHVEEVELISGHPLLVPSAIESVKQWVYRPTLLNGNPVGVVTQVDVNYTLADSPPPPPQQ